SSKDQMEMYHILSSSLEITSGIVIQMIQPGHLLSDSKGVDTELFIRPVENYCALSTGRTHAWPHK
ncbi:hypothetical protein BSL78_12409, partial [Apostichopus japonicus]